MDYTKAVELLGDKNHKPLKANTGLVRIEGSDNIGIRLYNTIIITYFPDGRVRLNVGDWDTRHSKDRINEYLGIARIYTMKSTWYVDYNGELYFYNNNMTLYPDGSCDAKHYSVYEFENAGVNVNTIEGVRQVIAGSTVEALKKLWRKCKYSRRLIAYYATLEFIPLIINTGYDSDPWRAVAKTRLIEG